MKYLLVFLAWTMPVVASLSNASVFGPTNGSVSDRYPTLIVVAGYAFAIWGSIFLLDVVYGTWQCLDRSNDPALQRTRQLTASGFALTSSWMIVFSLQWFWLSLTIIWLSLACILGAAGAIHPNGTSCPWTVVAMAASFVARGLDFAGCASQCGASHRGVSPASGQQYAAVDVAAVHTDSASGSNRGRTPAGQAFVHPGGALGSCWRLRPAARIGSRWCIHRRRGRHGARRCRGAAVSVPALATAGTLETHQFLRRLP